MTRLLLLLILNPFFLRVPTKSNIQEQDTQELYNLALSQTTGSDTIFRYHLGIPPLLNDNSKLSNGQIQKYNKWRAHMKSVLDTEKIFIVINERIDTLTHRIIEDIIPHSTPDKKDIYPFRGNKDSSFNTALRELCNNKLRPDTIKIAYLRPKFNYRILSAQKYKEYKDIHLRAETKGTSIGTNGNYHGYASRRFGTISFSKIGFTDNHKKAVIYTSFICGNLCGHGQVLFFEKLNGTWKYLKTWHLWAA